MKKKFFLTALVATLVVGVLSSSTVLAGNYIGKFPSGKIKYRVVYNSGYDNLSNIKSSVQKWNGVSSNVKLTYTTSIASAGITVDYMNYDPPQEETYGVTSLYYNGNQVGPNNTWNGAVCMVFKNKQLLTNTNARRATCTHEVGHALSLSHSYGKSDIMKQGKKNYTSLSSDDKYWLKNKWGE